MTDNSTFLDRAIAQRKRWNQSMTLKQLQAQVRQYGAIVRNVDGELQVKLVEWKTWEHVGVYFTDDRQDALDTARYMRETQTKLDAAQARR